MTLKSNVRFGDGSIAILSAMMVVEGVYRELNVEFVVTSFNDSTHMKNSLHYADRAFDIRTKTLPPNSAQAVKDKIQNRLTADFDVVLESDHIHVEFQNKSPLPPSTNPH